METNKSLFTATEYRDMKQRVDQLVEYVEFKRDEWQQAEAEQQLQKIREVEAERTRRARQEKQRKINSLISEAKALHAEQEYEKAVVVLEQVLKIDPTNSFARERQPMWVEDVNLNREAAADTMSRRQERLEMVNIRETGIPWHQLLRYPRNWRELTEKRKEYSLGAERLSAEDRRARQKLQTNIKSVDFSDVPFEDVLDFIREVTTANIYPEWNALQLAGIDRTKTVNVRLSDVSAEKLLEIVLDDVGAGLTELTYIIDRGVVQISTREALAGKTRIEVYDIRDLIVPIEDFDAPDMDFAEVSSTGTDGTGGGGGDDGGIFGDDDDDDDDDGDEDDTESRSEIRDKIISMIEEGTPADSWKINGGQGSLYIFNDQLVVTQTPDNHAKIKRMLDMLREAKDIQVSIEARFITVNTGFLDDIGIDLDFYFNLGSTLSMDPALTSVDPTTGATVPGRGNNPWIVGNPDVYKLSRRLTPMGFSQDSSSFTNQLGSGTGVPNSIAGLVTSSAMTLGGTFLDDIQVDFLIRATQAHQATRSLTAPRVTLLNGRQAFVQVGTMQAYVANLEPVVSENAVTFNPTVQYVQTGSTLEVRATVSADRRYVTLTLSPQVMSLNGFSRYFTQVEETDPNGEPIAGEGFIQLPNVTVQTVRTQVAVPDGGTLLLGGQKLAGEVEREMGVPMLNKVPWLNRLFTNRGKTRDEQTLLILIKPKILIQPEAEAEEKLYQEEPMLP
jgi:general secretion pathway protein D